MVLTCLGSIITSHLDLPYFARNWPNANHAIIKIGTTGEYLALVQISAEILRSDFTPFLQTIHLKLFTYDHPATKTLAIATQFPDQTKIQKIP